MKIKLTQPACNRSRGAIQSAHVRRALEESLDDHRALFKSVGNTAPPTLRPVKECVWCLFFLPVSHLFGLSTGLERCRGRRKCDPA
jgi:hypothetical protein